MITNPNIESVIAGIIAKSIHEFWEGALGTSSRASFERVLGMCMIVGAAIVLWPLFGKAVVRVIRPLYHATLVEVLSVGVNKHQPPEGSTKPSFVIRVRLKDVDVSDVGVIGTLMFNDRAEADRIASQIMNRGAVELRRSRIGSDVFVWWWRGDDAIVVVGGFLIYGAIAFLAVKLFRNGQAH